MEVFMKIRKFITVIILLGIIFFLALGFYNPLQITDYTYKSEKIPSSFDGYTIAFLSDLHCKSFGPNNEKLVHAIMEASPDLIVFTGDMIDEKHSDLTPFSALLDSISSVAPIYSVTGNHEYRSGAPVAEMNQLYAQYSVTTLKDESVYLYNIDSHILLTGIDAASGSYNTIVNFPANTSSDFSILLYHYSDQFPYLLGKGYDLIFSGHTHGGIVRLPFVGGLLDTTGTFFPEYDGGIYQSGYTTMLSSRGLGDAFFPRFYNRPELIIVTLESEE